MMLWPQPAAMSISTPHRAAKYQVTILKVILTKKNGINQ